MRQPCTGDDGLSGKKLPRGQALARELALKEVLEGRATEATVAYRPGDVAPRWVEVLTVPGPDGDSIGRGLEPRKQAATDLRRHTDARYSRAAMIEHPHRHCLDTISYWSDTPHG
jgi:hypothetical protein